jgi:antitoxin (DNA-binding transcriptional repressor) of toxin-antitoxin stability system
MSIYALQGNDTSLLRLLEVTQTGEEVVITQDGKPIARMLSYVNHSEAIKPAGDTHLSPKRELGFYPIKHTKTSSDLLAPTDESIIESFYHDATTTT